MSLEIDEEGGFQVDRLRSHNNNPCTGYVAATGISDDEDMLQTMADARLAFDKSKQFP